MAPPVYSVELGAQTNINPGARDLFVVPSGFRAVLIDVDVIETSLGVGQILLRDNSLPLAFSERSTTAASPSGQWTGRQVFDAGAIIGVYVIAGNFDARASGYLFTV